MLNLRKKKKKIREERIRNDHLWDTVPVKAQAASFPIESC